MPCDESMKTIMKGLREKKFSVRKQRKFYGYGRDSSGFAHDYDYDDPDFHY
jgi:hypothetical protein